MKTKLLARILAILGFGSGLTACMYAPAPMYAPLGKWFSARGYITDEAGYRIKGIKVSIGNGDRGLSDFTDAEGRYEISDRVDGDIALIEFEDIDGADNGGDFASTAISVDVDSENVPKVVMTLKESSDE